MDESVDWSRLRVTTTLHSHEKKRHEAANRKEGSFDRTLSGLHNIDRRGAQVIVKHCITGTNYRDLCEFYRFVDLEFGKHVPLYLCGIDYIGIPEERVKREKIGLPEIRPAWSRCLTQWKKMKTTDQSMRRISPFAGPIRITGNI